MSTRQRRSLLATTTLAAAWFGIVATSQPRWSADQRAQIPQFALGGGQSRAFRITVRPSAGAVTTQRLFTSIHARVRATVDGSPRPATVALDLVHHEQGGAMSNHNNEPHHGGDWTCSTVAACTHTYTLTARWPDAPPRESANVSIELDATVSGRGDAPRNAAVQIDFAPAP